MLRAAFVVTLAAAGGCCPSKPVVGDPCHFWQPSSCVGDGDPGDCGLNGYSCRDGKWREDFTYCNPPGPPPRPRPPAVPEAGSSASIDSGASTLDVVVGLTLKQAMTRLKLSFDGLVHHDEPPGKLRSVSIPAENNGGSEVRIYLVYQAADGMDAKRVWPAAKIGRLKVSGVTRRSAGDGGEDIFERAGVVPN